MIVDHLCGRAMIAIRGERVRGRRGNRASRGSTAGQVSPDRGRASGALAAAAVLARTVPGADRRVGQVEAQAEGPGSIVMVAARAAE
jgi:hypothetical protein